MPGSDERATRLLGVAATAAAALLVVHANGTNKAAGLAALGTLDALLLLLVAVGPPPHGGLGSLELLDGAAALMVLPPLPLLVAGG